MHVLSSNGPSCFHCAFCLFSLLSQSANSKIIGSVSSQSYTTLPLAHNKSANFIMDAPHTYMNPHQAQTDAVSITRILGIIAVGFTLISVVLFLCISWIIRVGKAEHAEKQKQLAKKQE